MAGGTGSARHASQGGVGRAGPQAAVDGNAGLPVTPPGDSAGTTKQVRHIPLTVAPVSVDLHVPMPLRSRIEEGS